MALFTSLSIPYGTVELSQANGPNFKVNGHRVKHYFGGNVPHLDCPDWEDFSVLSFIKRLCHDISLGRQGLGSGYQQQDRNQAKMTKLSMEWQKTVQNLGQSQKCHSQSHTEE
ncbi:hypothetical protein Tco_0859660 [Tanacetum coccineum]|uniref:Uncharacterized protein n=1 Tax=Tanacetum coccineum TaxID=301880 RepID=A0ABQ5BGI6_9ASTR